MDAPEPAPVEVMRLKLMGWSDVRPVTADQRCKPSDIGWDRCFFLGRFYHNPLSLFFHPRMQERRRLKMPVRKMKWIPVLPRGRLRRWAAFPCCSSCKINSTSSFQSLVMIVMFAFPQVSRSFSVMWVKHGETRINHPPVITICIAGINHSQSWVLHHCFTHIDYDCMG